MEKNEILKKVETIFRSVFDNNSLVLANETSALDIPEWNSLNHMILISEVECAFSIRFKLRDLNMMRNVGDMIEIIASKL
jgi:acyl carrier protein